jgi:hypothetical protein
MCQKKLTSRDRFAVLKRAKGMRDAGINIDIPEEWRDCAQLIIETGEYNSEVFDTRGGGSAAYALAVRLIPQKSITLLDYRITTPWDDEIVLANPPVIGQFYLHGGKEFSKESVLNSRLEKSLLLRAGQVVEGTILACGLKRIPDSVQHGSRPPCNLVFIDHCQNEISQEFPLIADRLWKRALLAPRRDGTSLREGQTKRADKNFNAPSKVAYTNALPRESPLPAAKDFPGFPLELVMSASELDQWRKREERIMILERGTF